MDEMIPYDLFLARVSNVRQEFVKLANQVKSPLVGEFAIKSYPASEEHITQLANELTKRRRYEDAINLLRLNLDLHPESSAIADTLSKAYRLSGNPRMAEHYSRLSAPVK